MDGWAGEAEEAQTIARAQQGDLAAFEQLVLRYEPLVSAYTRHLLDDPFDAEDVAQEAFYRAFRELKSLRDANRFASWLKSIAWRACRAWVRQKRVAREATREIERSKRLPGMQDFVPPDLEADDGDPWLERLERTLDGMSAGHRAVLSLFYLEHLPQEQIARFLDVPVGTVKRRLHEGRHRVAGAAERIAPGDEAARSRFVEQVKRLLSRHEPEKGNES